MKTGPSRFPSLVTLLAAALTAQGVPVGGVDPAVAPTAGIQSDTANLFMVISNQFTHTTTNAEVIDLAASSFTFQSNNNPNAAATPFLAVQNVPGSHALADYDVIWVGTSTAVGASTEDVTMTLGAGTLDLPAASTIVGGFFGSAADTLSPVSAVFGSGTANDVLVIAQTSVDVASDLTLVGASDWSGNGAVTNRLYHYRIDLQQGGADTDGDGLPDPFEQMIIDADPGDLITTLADVLPGDDFDGDASTNAEEFDRGTSPVDDDSDDDGLLDGHETNTGTYVSATDTGTSPLVADTDGDGLLDGMENNSRTFVSATDTGTDPHDPDTDDDGLLDGVENNDGIFVDQNLTGTDPHRRDSDGDLTKDGTEVAAGTDPNDPNVGGSDGFIAGQQTVALDQTGPDAWAICYIDEERPFQLGGGSSNAIQFNFFAAIESVGRGGRVTPFVAEVVAPNNFIVRAIGTTRVEGIDWSAEGLQSFPFSDEEFPVVEDGWVAGFITSDPDGGNPSNQIIPYAVNAGIEGWLTGSQGPADPGGLEVGLAPEPGISGTNTEAYGMRDYSFQIVAGRPDVITITEVAHDATADTTTLTWTSAPGELFQVRKSLTLEGDLETWVLSGAPIPAAAAPAESTTAVVDVNATEEAAYYRLVKIPPPPLFAEDFESGGLGWTTLDNGVSGATRWELGTPNFFLTNAHSPTMCYGTDLDAAYEADLVSGGAGIALRSPLIPLGGVPGATLEFWHFLDVGNLGDEGGLSFLDASGALLDVAAISPIVALTGDWTRLQVPLPASVIANGEVIIEWQFRSVDGGDGTFAGWYIDDVVVRP